MCCNNNETVDMHPTDIVEMVLNIRREMLSLRSNMTDEVVEVCDNILCEIVEGIE